jgi:hypothetical protein
VKGCCAVFFSKRTSTYGGRLGAWTSRLPTCGAPGLPPTAMVSTPLSAKVVRMRWPDGLVTPR